MPTHKPRPSMVLDTHAWLWLMEGSAKLGSRQRRRIEECAEHGRLLVSILSIWEIGMLESKSRILFEQDCAQWIQQALAVPGIELAPLTVDIALASTHLPGDFHGDPADRIIVATARAHACPLVTADETIRRWADAGHLSVLAL
ncbi:MAG TPA: type II toxin-antitoxin system VapC family toxin [Kiritimatiellia bacterium]|nr:type II toxin-antitoxin system VapC family toxin [Kiritimatiellia bacterium]